LTWDLSSSFSLKDPDEQENPEPNLFPWNHNTCMCASCFLRVFKFHMRFRVARGPPRVHRREEARSFVGGVWVGCRRFVNDLFRHTQMQSLGIKLLYARSRPSQPIVIRQPRTPYAHDSRRIQLTAAAANPLHRTAQTDRVHRRRTCHRRSSAGVSGERTRRGSFIRFRPHAWIL